MKVEKGGKIFNMKKQSIVTSEINIKKLDDTTYEVEIKNLTRVVSVRLPYALYEEIEKYAKIHKMTISDVIREALAQYLEHMK